MPGKRSKGRNMRPGRRVRMNALVAATSVPTTLGANVITHRLPCAPIGLTSVSTTGIITVENNISPPSSVYNWANSWQVVYDEYRVLSADIEMHSMALVSGETAFFICEGATGIGSPTYQEANTRPSKLLNNNVQLYSRANNTIRWRARDFTDLSFQSTTSSNIPFHYYVYTDSANFGAPTTATLLWIVRPYITIQFRGIRGNP
jgi:hypothetical protein